MKKWYEKVSEQSDIYVASRVRLVRNLKDYVFPCKLSDVAKIGLTATLQKGCEGLDEVTACELHGSTFEGFSQMQKIALKERRIINKSILQKEHPMGLLVAEDESVSMVFNGDDHIRMQVSMPGLRIEDAWRMANQIDDFLNQKFEYAFDERFGYMTTFPTNAGTGMRGYLLLHLPFLAANDGIKGLAREMSRYGLVVQGAFGDLDDNPGDVFVLSNQKTLGLSEKDIVEVLVRIAAHLERQELKIRTQALKKQSIQLQDRIYKSYGILKYARTLETAEALNCLSSIRCGIYNGLIEMAEPLNCYGLMMEVQDANLQVLFDKPMDQERLTQARCEYIQKRLPELV
ncbi:MAG: ATP--guanido phosphotransferase [Lachnospiraceae bacterium]|nr:ATP--guanido phosphotransferase [Lachnospiraceae bacterium]